ncbi:unnamed protein product [marine sediment metagenome]|uniref:Uncharacterized protein n=1 Tax=marine sediment metagenome TaxID=412755 RepID=X0X294_9ZZZZ
MSLTFTDGENPGIAATLVDDSCGEGGRLNGSSNLDSLYY